MGWHDRPMFLNLRIRGHQSARSRGRDFDSCGEQDAYLGNHLMEQYMATLLRCMAHEKVEDTNGFMRDQLKSLVGPEKHNGDMDVASGFVEFTLESAEGLPEG